MVGFYFGDPVDSRSLREAGLDVVPSSAGEVAGAVAGQALEDLPTRRALELDARGMRDTGYSFAAGVPVRIGEPAPLMSAADANKEFKLPGLVPFSAPVSRETAQEIFDAHQRKLARENAIERRDGGVLSGQVAQFGVGAITGLLDPLNVASAFIPVVPEAKIAAALAGASGAFGRAGVRAGVGAVEGAVGAAALEPLNYALDRASQNDWTMGNAAMNIALGGAMGGVLHPAIGVFGREERLLRARDRVQGVIDGLAPETRETAMRGALAQIVEGRRVNVADAIDAAEAMRAAGELRTWAEQTRRLTEETDAAIGSTTPRETADWGPVAAKARENLARLAEEANGIRAEIASVQVRTLRAALDPDTLARLNDIEGELAGTIPRARRQRLEQERQGILEGVNRERTVAGAADNIEVARGLAEEQGLRAALARGEAQRQAAEAAAGSTDEMVALAARQREADAATTDRGWSRREALIASKAEVIQALTERTLRRYAAQLGVEAGDAGRSALRILTAEDPGAEALAVLSEMRRGAPRRMGVPTPDDMKAQEAMDAALSRLYGEADRARMAAMDAERVTDSRTSDTAARVEELNTNAPKAEGVVEKQIAEVTKDLAALDAVIQAERNAGRFSPEQERILREFDDAAKMAEGDAKAMEAAGFCAAVRG